MVISRTPLRISLAGGGTDFPRWFEGRYGCVVGAAIDKYVYCIVNPRFEGDVRVAYASTEEVVGHALKVEHDLIREAMRLTGVMASVEIVTIGDVPGRGTGLGSSSAVTVGALNALRLYYAGDGERGAESGFLADEACEIELDILGKPIGKQDQYLCALGGVNCLEFLRDGQVKPEKLYLEWHDALGTKWQGSDKLADRLLLFYLGTTRCADDILEQQNADTEQNRNTLIALTHMARQCRSLLLSGDFDGVGKLMHEAWMLKQQLCDAIADEEIRERYIEARNAGALGGKVCGAGGGGFMLLYAPQEKQADVRKAMEPLKELPFKFDYEGTKIIHAD